MNKQDFNKLDMQGQLQYVNNELIKGKSLRIISTSLTMSKTTIRDRFLKQGYVFNAEQRQYIKKDNSIAVDNTYKHNTNILHDKTIDKKPIKRTEYKDNANIFNQDTKDKIFDIISNYNKLKEMLDWFETKKNIIELQEQELKIDSDRLIGKVKTTTVRLYDKVWNDFREFTDEFKEYKSMDLVSQALLEFMDKYKK